MVISGGDGSLFPAGRTEAAATRDLLADLGVAAARIVLEGNSRMELTRSGAQMAGPIVAGELIHLVQAPGAIVVDTLSFIGSVVFVSRIRRVEPPIIRGRGGSARMRDEAREGLRYVLRHELLLPIAATTALFNLSLSMGGAVYMISGS